MPLENFSLLLFPDYGEFTNGKDCLLNYLTESSPRKWKLTCPRIWKQDRSFRCIEWYVNGNDWDSRTQWQNVMLSRQQKDLWHSAMSIARRAGCLLFCHSVSTSPLLPFMSETLLSLKQSRSTTCILWRHLHTCHPLWPNSLLGSVPWSHVYNPSFNWWQGQN